MKEPGLDYLKQIEILADPSLEVNWSQARRPNLCLDFRKNS